MFELLREMSPLRSPAGCEDELREYVKKSAAPYASEIKEDAMGNLLIYKTGEITPPKRIMFTTQLDEPGLLVKRIDEEGFLRFGVVGRTDPRVLIGKRVLVGEHRLPGVIGLKAIHLTTREERKVVPKVSSMYIDIGATDRADGEKFSSVGDYCVLDGELEEFGAGLLKGRALDSRVGCALLLQHLRSSSMTAVYAFTVQENVGRRGALTAAFGAAPDIVVGVSGVNAADLPGVPEGEKICELGKGAVISYMDDTALFDRELTDCLLNSGSPVQPRTTPAGTSGAGQMTTMRAGMRACLIGMPVRYAGTPASLISLSDLDAAYQLTDKLTHYLEEM